MFTVKHVRFSGEEELHQTVTARYTPSNRNAKATEVPEPSETPETLWIDSGPLTGGTVFVMNENGKTVSRYDLGASMVAFGRDPHLTSLSEDKLSQPKRYGPMREALENVQGLQEQRGFNPKCEPKHDPRYDKARQAVAEQGC